MIKKVSIPDYHFDKASDSYILDEAIEYYSERYRKWVTVRKGFTSDGATGAYDVISLGWWVHDKLCLTNVWEDGTPCTRWQGSTVLHDILKQEGRWFRKTTWRYATMIPAVWRKALGFFS